MLLNAPILYVAEKIDAYLVLPNSFPLEKRYTLHSRPLNNKAQV